MTQELFYTVFRTNAGWVGLLGSTDGLQRLVLPCPSQQEAVGSLGNVSRSAIKGRNHFDDLIERLQAYFAGERADFPDKLDLSGATVFQCDVWQAARQIPYGETRSYGWLAGQIGKPDAARAVGQALGRNPVPIIIPCHRVLAANGGLGGFSGGIEMKGLLLGLESVKR